MVERKGSWRLERWLQEGRGGSVGYPREEAHGKKNGGTVGERSARVFKGCW